MEMERKTKRKEIDITHAIFFFMDSCFRFLVHFIWTSPSPCDNIFTENSSTWSELWLLIPSLLKYNASHCTANEKSTCYLIYFEVQLQSKHAVKIVFLPLSDLTKCHSTGCMASIAKTRCKSIAMIKARVHLNPYSASNKVTNIGKVMEAKLLIAWLALIIVVRFVVK